MKLQRGDATKHLRLAWLPQIRFINDNSHTIGWPQSPQSLAVQTVAAVVIRLATQASCVEVATEPRNILGGSLSLDRHFLDT
jgi:hypothetical protein